MVVVHCLGVRGRRNARTGRIMHSSDSDVCSRYVGRAPAGAPAA
jgi:hypothetical protein